jgi:hypothetical protein
MTGTRLLIKNGNIILDDFKLNENIPLTQCLDDLKEDMLQVEYPGGYILDIGWRPSFNSNGQFYVVLIKDYDWEHTIYHGTAKNIDNLKKRISEASELL